MAATRLSIVTPNPKEADQGFLNQISNDRDSLARISDFVNAIAGGDITAKVRMNTGAVQAEGQVAFDSFVQDDTVTVNGTVVTGRTTPSTTSQFAVGASDEAAANNFYTFLKASGLDKIVGVVVPYRRGTIIVSSMAAADTVTINGVIFTCTATPDAADPRQFALGLTDALTAENLKNAILAASARYSTVFGTALLSISRSTATLTINMDSVMTFAASAHATLDNDMVQILCITPGQIGNLMTLAISAHGTKTDPTGGTEGTASVYAISRTIL